MSFWLFTCLISHLVVPIGRIFGDVIGGIEGGTMLQIPIQGSGMSNALVQIGSISPSTHMHLHAALVFSE